MTRRFLLSAGLLFISSLAFALFGNSGGPDYSSNSGNMFYCSDLSGTPVTTQAGLSVTAPALVLTNPITSTKLLTILDVGIDVTASPAAATGFSLAYSTGGAAITMNVAYSSGNIVGFSTNVYVDSARVPSVINSTNTQVALSQGQCVGGLGTVLPNKPIAFRYIGGTTGASAIGGVVFTDQTQGKVVVPPGSTLSIQSTTAAAIIADFLWREDPL